jgi:NAD(P)-dependent dehydrogenase (short-subunit alcohol dehydrogenase family)/acyl carrier protein
MMRFQDVMARFLETQKSVMMSYLHGAPAAPAAAHANGHLANGYGTNGHAAPPPVRPAAVPAAPAANGQAAPRTSVGEASSFAPAAKLEASPTEVKAKAEVAPAQLDRESLLAKLLDLVSERTGYPKEALSIDLDLEADLGVDSIKRIEILGSLAESIGAGGNSANLEMEKLTVIKTLRGIADYVMEALAAPAEKTAAPAPKAIADAGSMAAALPAAARQGDVQRLVVRLIDAPPPARPTFSLPAGTILLTDDRQGIARELADRLADLDVKTALIRMASDDQPADAFAADLTDPAAVADLLGRVRQEVGPVAGLIHLLPLAEPPEGEDEEERMRREVKSLYLLARGLEEDVRSAGKQSGALLLSVTGLGGRIGFGRPLPDGYFAGHGGVAGFTKCLGYEWPEVLVRVVDLDPERPAPEQVDRLLGELGDPDGPFEVGYDNGRRVTWQCDPGPVDQTAAPAVELGPDSTVLITGGARGVTAKVALEFAKRFRPKLVLVGRSPLPAEEPADTANLSTPAELKAALMARFQREGKPAVPSAVEAAYQRLRQDREIRGNLEAIRAAGGKVEYRALDVRDEEALGGLIEELNRQGGLDGVIHGAGVIDDKLVRDKTPESFDRVFGTKVESALTLARRLDPKRLKFCVFFASITSRYGNRGQSDYAAANEVLSKLAIDLDRRWPARVVSMCWGPWAGVGMVADLEKHLVARGLQLISPERGPVFVVDELLHGRKGEPEVVIAGGTEQAAKPQRPARPVRRPGAEPVGAET